MLRGNAGQDIVFTPADRRCLYGLMEEGVARFGYRVHAFCLMRNQLQLALQAGDEPLSVSMQNLASRYTRHLNTRLKRAGHVFEGRFKSYLVDQDRYGIALVRYIHLNPVRARKVKQPAAYAFSSHRVYLGQADLPWLTTDWVLGKFGTRVAVARRRYASFIEQKQSLKTQRRVFDRGQFDSRIVGEKDFIKKVLKSKSKDEKRPTLAQIVTYVCRESGMSKASMVVEGRNRAAADTRALVAWLAVKNKASSLTAVSEFFGRDLSTVSHSIARLVKRARSSKSFANTLAHHNDAISRS